MGSWVIGLVLLALAIGALGLVIWIGWLLEEWKEDERQGDGW